MSSETIPGTSDNRGLYDSGARGKHVGLDPRIITATSWQPKQELPLPRMREVGGISGWSGQEQVAVAENRQPDCWTRCMCSGSRCLLLFSPPPPPHWLWGPGAAALLPTGYDNIYLQDTRNLVQDCSRAGQAFAPLHRGSHSAFSPGVFLQIYLEAGTYLK